MWVGGSAGLLLTALITGGATLPIGVTIALAGIGSLAPIGKGLIGITVDWDKVEEIANKGNF